jgi:hypothetical protein
MVSCAITRILTRLELGPAASEIGNEVAWAPSMNTVEFAFDRVTLTVTLDTPKGSFTV